jgi:hypothetical protein
MILALLNRLVTGEAYCTEMAQGRTCNVDQKPGFTMCLTKTITVNTVKSNTDTKTVHVETKAYTIDEWS